MYKSIDEYEFVDAFKHKDNFSREGLFSLFDYFEKIEEETETKIELDIVAICCDYSEYDSAYDAMYEYKPDDMPTLDDSEGMDLVEITQAIEYKCLEWLEERTQVIPVAGTGRIIISKF